MKTKPHAVTLEEYERSIHQGSFKPVCLFTGEEDFLIDEAVDVLLREVVEEPSRAFNLDIFYGTDADTKHIVAVASAYPMMAERRTVVVREFDKLPDKEGFLPYLEHPSPSTCLVIISGKPDFRQKVYKTIRENGSIFEFGRLYEDRIPEWITRRIQKGGKKTTAEACQLMLACVGNSLREIQNEIEKLFIYVGDKQTIGEEDVKAVVGMTRQYNIFALQEAIGRGDLGRSIEIMERMLDAGENPVGMIVMLTKFFQKLYLLRELQRDNPRPQELASRLSVNPYFINAYLEALRHYSDGRIERCFMALAAADEAIKSTAADHKLVMTLMIYNLFRDTDGN